MAERKKAKLLLPKYQISLLRVGVHRMAGVCRLVCDTEKYILYISRYVGDER